MITKSELGPLKMQWTGHQYIPNFFRCSREFGSGREDSGHVLHRWNSLRENQCVLNQGFQDVRQLEGGVLGYFEEVGGAHWNGDCFVFDRRVAMDPELNVTGAEFALPVGNLD